MSTAFQEQQVKEIHKEHSALIKKLQASGAVAEIGFVHYEGMHTNVCTVLSVGKYGPSKCIKGNDPLAAIVGYAKAYFGGGKLKKKDVVKNDDGSVGVSYLVFQE